MSEEELLNNNYVSTQQCWTKIAEQLVAAEHQAYTVIDDSIPL